MASASLDDILFEDQKERFSCLEFYQNNHDALMDILLKDIEFVVLNRIAVILHGTMLGESEWMAFLNALGIVDNVFITWIKLKAKSSEELPIYLALRGPLQHMKTFGQVINVLIAKERYDVLHDIKSFVEGLLNKNTDTDLKQSLYSDSIQPTAPTYDDDIKVEKTQDFNSDTMECKLEKNELQQSEFNYSLSQNSVAQKIHKGYKTPKIKLMISVLLLHAQEDASIAIKLCSILNQEGMVVRMLSDLDYLLLMNSTETIHALLSTVDFIIPIVSESFLAEIHPNRSVSSQRNALSWEVDVLANNTNNHYIYQLLLEEFIKNRCLNFRVRPVMVPNMSRHSLKYEILLTCSLRLWETVPKLIEVLKKTKLMLRS